MKLTIIKDRVRSHRKYRPKVGEMTFRDGYMILNFYHKSYEVIAVEGDEVEERQYYDLYAVQPELDKNEVIDYREEPIGSLKVTKNGGVYVTLNHQESGFQVIDPERFILAKKFEYQDETLLD